MTEVERPIQLIAPQLDLSKPDVLQSSIASADRWFQYDSKTGTQAWNVWNQLTYTVSAPGQLTWPEYIELQLQILNTSTNFNGSINQILALEAGLPMFTRVTLTAGNSQLEQNSLPQKTALIRQLIADEAGYCMAQSFDDAFFSLDLPSVMRQTPLAYSTTASNPIIIASGTTAYPSAYIPYWDLIAAATAAGTTFGGANAVCYPYLQPSLGATGNTGNLGIPGAIIPSAYYNPGFIQRAAKTLAADTDTTIWVRTPVRKILGFIDTYQPQVFCGTTYTIQCTLAPLAQFITFLTATNVANLVVNVISSRMCVTTYTPQPGLQEAVQQFLKSGRSVERTFQSWDGIQQPMAASTGGNFALGALKGQAQRIWLYLQTQTRDSSYTQLKSYAEQYFPSTLYIQLGGLQFPKNQYSSIDNHDFERAYRDFLATTNHFDNYGSAGQILSYTDWFGSYPIYGFLIPNNINAAGQNLTVQINFPSAISNPVFMNTIIQYQNKVQVTYANGQDIFGVPA